MRIRVPGALAVCLCLLACSDQNAGNPASPLDEPIHVDPAALEASRAGLQDAVERMAISPESDLGVELRSLGRSLNAGDFVLARVDATDVMESLNRADPKQRDPELAVVRLALESVYHILELKTPELAQ